MSSPQYALDRSTGSADFDAILLGAGHNTLILQAYLGRAGLKTLCIERRDHPGGGLETLEDPRYPGFLHNTHSFFHRGITHMPWYRDLELERHGARYVEPDLNVAMILRDGRTLEWWTDFEKTYDSFAQIHKKDAETLRRWQEEFIPIVEQVLIPESQSPPLPPERRRELLGKSQLGRRLLEVSQLTPLGFAQREFDHPAVQAGLLFFNGLREVDLRAPGFGHHIPALLASPAKAQLCLGGSAGLARALVSAVKESGGEIALMTTPRRILVEGGRAVGVETTRGELIRARYLVVSGLNPQQTFLDLVDEENLPSEWRERARAFRYNLIAPLFALNLNLKEPPLYQAAEKSSHIQRAFMVILGLDHVDQFSQIVTHHQRKTIPPTVMWGASPSVFDETQAPSGCHTAFMWEKLPYNLHGDPSSWDQAKVRHGQEMLALWQTYAPNLRDALIDSFVRSPLDTERSLVNMQGGDLLVGAFSGGQVGYDRPFPGAGHYRSHLPGLFLCGSSSHPGGNITGLPGYNSAQVILNDLGLEAGWIPEPVEKQLERLI